MKKAAKGAASPRAAFAQDPMTRISPTPSAPRVLLVNPWIFDFAAYDFFARPLGLMLLGGMLARAGFTVDHFDCLAARKPGRFGSGSYRKTPVKKPGLFPDVPRRYSRYGVSPEDFKDFLAQAKAPDAVLVTSLMTYWYPGVFEVIAMVREAFPGTPVILGGIYATLCPDHAREKSGADHVVQGPGEEKILPLLETLTGHAAEPDWRPENPDSWPEPMILEERPPFVVAATSLGCPFRCEYCASRLLRPGFTALDPLRSADRILEACRRHRVRDVAFYDDALLVNPASHALPLLDRLAEGNPGLRLHTPNAVHAKNLTPAVARALKRAGTATLRMGVETADFGEGRLDEKISGEDFEAAVANLGQAGFDRSRVGAYLLVGLPNQDYGQVEQSIRAVARAGIRPVLAHYSPIPGTPLWEEARKASRYDLAADPLFTNNAVFPCQKEPFSWERLSRLKALARE